MSFGNLYISNLALHRTNIIMATPKAEEEKGHNIASTNNAANIDEDNEPDQW